MKLPISDFSFGYLHGTLDSELGQITEEILNNLEFYEGSTKLSSEIVIQKISQLYKLLRLAIFNNFYNTHFCYLDADELSLPNKYFKHFVGNFSARENYNFRKFKITESNLDSDANRFFKKATKEVFDLFYLFDNPTERMNEDSIIKDSKNGFLGHQTTFDLDEATSIYRNTDWMKSEKLEKMLIKIYSSFNYAAQWQASGGSTLIAFKAYALLTFEILFLIGNIFLSNWLSDGNSQFTALILIALYFLKFYNPLTVAHRNHLKQEDNNFRFLAKIHNKIMSNDYFCPTIVREEFLELDKKGLNISRYVFRILV